MRRVAHSLVGLCEEDKRSANLFRCAPPWAKSACHMVSCHAKTLSCCLTFDWTSAPPWHFDTIPSMATMKTWALNHGPLSE